MRGASNTGTAQLLLLPLSGAALIPDFNFLNMGTISHFIPRFAFFMRLREDLQGFLCY
jgi:hypothetical protein